MAAGALLLEARSLYYTYPGGVEALKGACLTARKGETVAVIGPNGCGKTTLLLLAAGLLRPKQGEVLLDGRPIASQLPGARRRIGLVFQDPDDQLFNPTVYDEIAFALRQLEIPEEEVDALVRDVAGRLGLTRVLSRPPYRLSVGEKRRTALASVLVYRPELLLLDEPTANMSPGNVAELEALIRRLKDEDRAIVVTSHNVEFVARVADTVYVMSRGKTICSGPVRRVLADEDLLAKAGLRPPMPVQVYRLLFDGYSPPMTLEELVDRLRRLRIARLCDLRETRDSDG